MSERDLDFQLIQRIQNGEQQAFTLLVRKYQNRVANILTRYVRNSGDIADVTQEVFIKVHKSLPSFRGDSAFYTWLYRIGENGFACFSHHKSVYYQSRLNFNSIARAPYSNFKKKIVKLMSSI